MGTMFGVLIGYYILSGNMFRDIHNWGKNSQNHSPNKGEE